MKYVPLFLVASGLLAFGGASIFDPPEPATPPPDGWSQEWTGVMVDADCKSVDVTKPCQITDHTRTFGIVTQEGRFFKFDAGGNLKAREALRTKRADGNVSASVIGYLFPNFIKVERLALTDLPSPEK